MRLLNIFAASILLLSGATATGARLNTEKELNYCKAQTFRTLREITCDTVDYSMMPRNIALTESKWNLRRNSPEEWCNGFWPGILWYTYEVSGDPTLRSYAERYTESLEFLSQRPAFDHDLGFLVYCSYGNGYRLTGNPKYRQVILDTADSLATLYRPKVGTILSWPRNVEMLGGHNTIMDNMINLEMLFWAAKNGGDRKLYDIAVKHAEVTMENHFRPDYSCYHVAVYDPETGKFLKGMTHQGYADNSMWARGQAWAIYGYTVVYRETGDPKFLDFACKVTDVYLSRLPKDYVPYWDFDDPSIPAAPRDASAAGVVASALLELQAYCDKDRKTTYRKAAEKMLASLSTAVYQSRDKRPSFLDHSTGHKPAGSEIDASIIYADYYYLEALVRLKKLKETGNAL